LRLRFEVQESGGAPDPNPAGYHLEYEKNSTPPFVRIEQSATFGGTPTNIGLANSPNIATDRVATTDQLTAGTGTFLPGEVNEDSADDLYVGTGPGANQQTENEWVLAPIPADVAPGDTFLIRTVNTDTGTVVPLGSGVSWPVLSIIASVVPKKPRPYVFSQAMRRSYRW
jgi:hypothetical protein